MFPTARVARSADENGEAFDAISAAAVNHLLVLIENCWC
jgi:hypothetical protein